MSFLGRRLAATEGAFFSQQSKAAAKLLKEKLDLQVSSSPSPSAAATPQVSADALPEILRHSSPRLPPGISALPVELPSSPITETSAVAVSQTIMKQAAKLDTMAAPTRSGTGPLHLHATVPAETTFGPRRWNIDHVPDTMPVPSTANVAKLDALPVVDAPTQKEVAQGMFEVAKAFGAATAIVFGGAGLAIAWACSTLDLHSLEDVKTKGRAAMVPKVEAIRRHLKPAKAWANEKGEKWKMEEAERQALGMEFAGALGVQPAEQANWKRTTETP